MGIFGKNASKNNDEIKKDSKAKEYYESSS